MPPAAVPMRRRHRARWLLPIFALAALTLLLEGALQVVAYAVWALQRQPVVEASGRTALCVGDSWTHGMGSADPSVGSYPARLQTELRSNGLTDWSVVNCGQSGQNSRDVLERLPAQLAQYRPAIVCVLVGQNDYWSLPQPLAADEQSTIDHSAYRFRWRLPRLLRWAVGNLRGVGAPAEVVRDPAQWQARVVPPQVDPYGNEPSTWPWTPEIDAMKAEGWRRIDAHDLAGAERSFASAQQASPGDPQCHHMLAMLHRLAGRTDAAAKELDWLREANRAQGGHRIGGALAMALVDAGQWREGLDVLQALLARFPDSADYWRQCAWCQFQLGELDAALASIDRSIALGYDKWSYFYRHKICCSGNRNVAEGARSLFACYVRDNDATLLDANLRIMAHAGQLAPAREVAVTFPCAADVRERMVTITDDVASSLASTATDTTLAWHLERIVLTIRNAGATPVLLTYPWQNEAEKVLREVALEQGTPFVETRLQFVARNGTAPMQQLRATDGHCNDAGYQLMAAIVAEQVLPLLRPIGR